MTRLFISHSSTDTIAAKAFKQWLGANGWPDDDVFLDVDDIGAGERWKDALRSANFRCEAVILLASPEALSSPECLAEIRKAEDYGKEIIVVLLRDVQLNDRRLDGYKERQIVDLAATPQNHLEVVTYRDEPHTVQFNGAALERIKSYLFKRGITPDHFAWPPTGSPDADPFPGLSSFTEDDAGIFFGRDADILRGLDRLRITRRNGRPRTLVIQAASGAGKSSYLRAGLWPRLERDPEYVPLAIIRPSKGILSGSEGLSRKLASRLTRPDRPLNPGDIQAQLTSGDLAQSLAHFKTLVAATVARALEQRRIGDNEAAPPALILAIDQAEELLEPELETEAGNLLDLLTGLLLDPPAGIEPYMIFAVRADSTIRLFEMLEKRGLEPPEMLPLLPLPRTSYRDVILKPLEMLGRRGQKLTITPELVERLVADSAGADALPLLAFTLSNLYRDFAAAGTITLNQYETMGGIAGCIELALKQALSDPRGSPAIPTGKQAQLAGLRAAFIPWLARINPETGFPMRRVARMDEFIGEPRALVERLISARLLVLDQKEGINVVEVAHESLLRQWRDLTAWLDEDAERLKIIEGVEWAAREWAHSKERSGDRLEHRSNRLRAAEQIASREDFRKRLGTRGLAYLAACRAAERRRDVQFRSIVGGLLGVLFAGVLAWRYEPTLTAQMYWLTDVRGFLLSGDQEHGLKASDQFKECRDCPEMVVVPGGSFTMGAQTRQGFKDGREYPSHTVTIAAKFAIAMVPVTSRQFGACAAHGDCDPEIASQDQGELPAVNLTWNDAQDYAAWLRKITGKPYRLLSEAEYEYAERGGSTTLYPWGDQPVAGHANCGNCGGIGARPAVMPVGSFPPNGYGLYDMVGNVFEWVADCFHADYSGAPTDGSVWDTTDCPRRVVRGASWISPSTLLRSSWRDWHQVDDRSDEVGFRVARLFTP